MQCSAAFVEQSERIQSETRNNKAKGKPPDCNGESGSRRESKCLLKFVADTNVMHPWLLKSDCSLIKTKTKPRFMRHIKTMLTTQKWLSLRFLWSRLVERKQ